MSESRRIKSTRAKTKVTKNIKEDEDFVESDVVIDMCKGNNGASTSSSSDNDDGESDDNDDLKELQAHQFEWHTASGLLEGLSFHYDVNAYENKGTEQQIDMLVKKYTPAQLKPVFIMSSIAASDNTKDLNLNVITTKIMAGTKLKEIIVPIIDGDESDDESRGNGNR